jgi:hypothetical protein
MLLCGVCLSCSILFILDHSDRSQKPKKNYGNPVRTIDFFGGGISAFVLCSLPETFVVKIATTTQRNEFVMFVLDPCGT